MKRESLTSSAVGARVGLGLRAQRASAYLYGFPILLGLVLRLWCFLDRQATGAFSQLPDTVYYMRRAREIFLFAPVPSEGVFMSPLYPYLLALTRAPVGSAWGIIALQMAVAAVALVLTGWAVGKAFGHTAGLAAALLLAVAPPMVFFDTTMLADGMATSASAIAAAAFACGQGARTIGWWLLGGLGLALAVGLRPNLLLLAVALTGVLYSWRRKGEVPASRAVKATLAAFGPTAAILCATAALNACSVGRPYPLPWNGGFNLFAGNNAEATGYYSGYGLVTGSDPMAAEPVTKALGRPVRAPEIDKFWRDRALAFIRNEPAKALGLLAKKVFLFFLAEESPQNEDLELEREYAPVLNLGVINFGLLVAFATFGLRKCVRRSAAWPWLAVGASAFLTCVIFFVNGRLRLPAWVGLAAPAGVGVAHLCALLRAAQWARLVRCAFVVAAIVATTTLPGGRSTAERALAMYRYAVLEVLGGREDLAEFWLKRAQELPTPPEYGARVALERAAVLAALGRYREAFPLVRKAADGMPHNRRAQRGLLSVATSLKRAGAEDPEIEQAIVDARRRLEAIPY